MNSQFRSHFPYIFPTQVSVDVPAELKAGDRLHVKVPYPEKHNGIVASPPPDNLYRIIADNTNFFYGSENGKLMFPAFDVADNLVSFLFVCWLVGYKHVSVQPQLSRTLTS